MLVKDQVTVGYSVIFDADNLIELFSDSLLDKAKNSLMLAYVGKSGMEADRVSSLMDGETWMTAAEALEHGFADQVDDGLPMAAMGDLSAFDLFHYHNVPTGIKFAASRKEVIACNNQTMGSKNQKLKDIVENCSAAELFNLLVVNCRKERKLSRAAAIKYVAINFPEAHQNYIMEANKKWKTSR